MSKTTSEYLPEQGEDEAATTTTPSGGWFRAMRTPDAFELQVAAPNAFRLAWIIAYRGQYRDGFNRHNLALGEALLGDYQSYGMSEREYRTAKKQLTKWRFATFKATNKGTVGKLTDTRLFSIFRLASDGQNDSQATDSRRTGDGQPTTTKNIRALKSFKNIRAVKRFNKTEAVDPTK